MRRGEGEGEGGEGDGRATMQFVPLTSLEQLAFALSGVAPSARVVLFDAVWARQQRSIRERDDLLSSLGALGLQTLFVVTSVGNDDVERYVLETLSASSLPVLVAYSQSPSHGGALLPPAVWIGSSVDSVGVSLLSAAASASNAQRLEPVSDRPAFDAALLALLSDPQAPPFGPLFVAGDKSSVGKSSTCLALLSTVLRLGLRPEDVAYIKPVTQCEAEQLVTRFCLQRGIACVGVGPVVFYKGFTRAFLAGETEPSAVLVQRAVEAVRRVGVGKRLVLVDGVGYPAVGSVCGISNADVALALGAPVLLVGKSGVGDAIDSFNLNAAFFESRGVRVLGGVFNKLPAAGFYSRESCAKAVGAYFEQFRPRQRAYGFVPAIEAGAEGGAEAEAGAGAMVVAEDGGSDSAAAQAQEQEQDRAGALFLSRLGTAFERFVCVRELLLDLWLAGRAASGASSGQPSSAVAWSLPSSSSSSPPPSLSSSFLSRATGSAGAGVSVQAQAQAQAQGGPASKRARADGAWPLPLLPALAVGTNPVSAPPSLGLGLGLGQGQGAGKRSREEIEAAARMQGARGG